MMLLLRSFFIDNLNGVWGPSWFTLKDQGLNCGINPQPRGAGSSGSLPHLCKKPRKLWDRSTAGRSCHHSSSPAQQAVQSSQVYIWTHEGSPFQHIDSFFLSSLRSIHGTINKENKRFPSSWKYPSALKILIHYGTTFESTKMPCEHIWDFQ